MLRVLTDLRAVYQGIGRREDCDLALGLTHVTVESWFREIVSG